MPTTTTLGGSFRFLKYSTYLVLPLAIGLALFSFNRESNRSTPLTASLLSTSTAPTMSKAVIVKEKGQLVIESVPELTVSDSQVLIKSKAVSINPIDWKMSNFGFLIESWPTRLGYDVSGEITKVGSKAAERGFKAGDKVFALTTGNAFGEYSTAEAIRTFKLPSNLSFEDGATFPTALSTAVYTLFADDGLKLARPNTHTRWFAPEYVVIWGGATSVGMYAVQLASAAGYNVIATASPKNHELVRSLGASHVVDYKRDDVVEEIKKLTAGRARAGLDLVGHGDAIGKLSQVLRANADIPAKIVSITSPDFNSPEGISFKFIMGLAPAVGEFVAKVLDEEVLEYFVQGRLKVNKVTKLEGLEGVLKGLDDSANGRVSAEKLVAVL
ncbi:chaperonin 10-like protein [Fimicolochytrium jonesii]|uniref:chaperonin 10-like protein n=1 Tax=Fimicolochytrium jonesii TaxID=1396493 RepID=UPI0022FDE187|nr:chaperonin 10-like protein [Fimicolochytrium jonesii]KAI8826835.1 chaperonin 10-like protein [Fimicolochytrium jonesii]